MNTTANGTVAAALEAIRNEHDGVLRAEDVVSAATPLSSVLHDYFEWDDKRAGHEFRLWQARMLIRVSVTVIEPVDKPVRAYVSLKADRREPGGGYRQIQQVMSDEEMRRQLLQEALDELLTFRRKYQILNELAPVFDGIEMVRERQLALVAAGD